MEQEIFRINGGFPLYGSVTLHGAKNAVLPLLAAAILTDKPVTICDCPDITDVTNMLEILRVLNIKIDRNGREITVSGTPTMTDIPSRLSKVMRSSMFLLGALLTVTGEVRLFTPGGCKIGARPLDIHLDGLKQMGATVEFGDDYVHCFAKKLVGADIVMKYPSVGATENLMMSAVLAKGRTTLINCAREPEIVSIACGLKAMGAKIFGEGTSVMIIDGVDTLDSAKITPVEDRIVCGTTLSAVAVCGGRCIIENANIYNLQSVVETLRSAHCQIKDEGGCITVKSDGIILPSVITTGPYPLFPTDMQAQIMALQCSTEGISSVTETVFENRFQHIAEYKKMGASIRLNNRTATIYGKKLRPSLELQCPDLRGGAGIIIAALRAHGESNVSNIEFVDRGYENIDEMFRSLGAKISRRMVLKN
ncbi:MAG: UDP-N-acetylglucosamine 1-carboxyvinyltransferase [Clostridia bacterium]